MPYEPRVKTVTVRMNKADYKKIEILADTYGVKLSTFIYLKMIKEYFKKINGK